MNAIPKNLNNIYNDTAKLKGTFMILGNAEYKKDKESASDWMKFKISPSDI